MPKREQESLKDHEELEPGQWVLAAAEEFRAVSSLQRGQFSLQRRHSGYTRVKVVLSRYSEIPYCYSAEPRGWLCWELIKRGKRAILKVETTKANIEEREIEKIPISLRILTKIEGKRPKDFYSFGLIFCISWVCACILSIFVVCSNRFSCYLGFSSCFEHIYE